MWPLRILHFPVRSSAQFKRRTEVAIFEGHYPDWGRFKRLREIYEEGRLDELYDELALADEDVAEGIREGRLVSDERFAHLLPCPTHWTAASRAPLGVEPGPKEAEAERDELEFDAMQLLARTSRWTTLQRERGRERSESLMADVKATAKERDAARRVVKRKDRRIEAKNKRVERAESRVEDKRKQVEKLRRRLTGRARTPVEPDAAAGHGAAPARREAPGASREARERVR